MKKKPPKLDYIFINLQVLREPMSHCAAFDFVWGSIDISEHSASFIDSIPFHRMKSLHQLGVTQYIYNSATHNRYQHSIGVYNLAREQMNIIKNSCPELLSSNSEWVNHTEMVSIAGLTHDLGHGPFSHLFEDILHSIGINDFSHEEMTCKIIQYIVDNYNVDIDYIDINHICDLIMASENCKNSIYNHIANENAWLYEIIANPRNGLDVDKFDYLPRDSMYTGVTFAGCNSNMIRSIMNSAHVIENEICYNISEVNNVCNIFKWRAYMHREVYQCSRVKAIEHMFTDIFTSCADFLKIREKYNDPEHFMNLTDEIIYVIQTANINSIDPEFIDDIQNAKIILDRIRSNKPYALVSEFDTSVVHDYNSNSIIHDIVEYWRASHGNEGELLQENELRISKTHINYGMSNRNPMDYVHFYNDSDVSCKFKADESIIDSMEEQSNMIYFYTTTTDSSKIDIYKSAINNYFKDK